MRQIERVTQFMDCLFHESLPKQVTVSRQSIKFLAQAIVGDHASRTAHLCLTEDKRENGDVKIGSRDAKNPPRIGCDELAQLRQDLA